MALEGHLRDLPLIDMLYIFQASHKVGKVCFTHGTDLGMIWLQDGQLVHAIAVNARTKVPLAQGEEAIALLFEWSDASFRFMELCADEQVKVSITSPLEVVLFNALQQRQSKHMRQSHLEPNSLVRLAPQLAPSCSGGISLSIDHWRIISHLVVETSVEQLADELNYSYDQLIKLLEEMITLNLVNIHTPLAVPQRQCMVGTSLAPQQQQRHVRSLVEAVKQRLRFRMQRGGVHVSH